MGQAVETLQLQVPLFAEQELQNGCRGNLAYLAGKILPANEQSFCLDLKAHKCEPQGRLCTPCPYHLRSYYRVSATKTKHSYLKSLQLKTCECLPSYPREVAIQLTIQSLYKPSRRLVQFYLIFLSGSLSENGSSSSSSTSKPCWNPLTQIDVYRIFLVSVLVLQRHR